MLIGGEHKLARLNRPADENGQNARSHRIERACVSRFRRTQKTLYAVYNRLRGESLALIYNNYAA